MPFELDAVIPQGVRSAKMMVFYVGNPPKQMQIFTGIAIPEFNQNNDEDVGLNEAIVRLGGKTTPVFQAVCTVALASVSADNSDFLFAVDPAEVITDPVSGDLMLRAGLAAKGDQGTLHRFAYHAMVLSDPLTPKIAGHIRWRQTFGDATQAVKQGVTTMFQVQVGTSTQDPAQPGEGPSIITWTFTPLASTNTTVLPLPVGDEYVVPYVIDNVPLGPHLVVKVTLNMGALDGPDSTFDHHPYFSSSPDLQLSPSRPIIDDADVEMTFQTKPR